MGECYFFMKAKFPSAKHLTKVLPDIKKFIKEGQKAEEWWQDHRGNKPAEFWPAFQTNFPTVTEFLKQTKLFGGDTNNALSGNLEFGNDEIEQATSADGSEFCWSSEVWHMGTWETFPEFFKTQFGAQKIVWGSEEEGVNLDSLQLYDYPKIVDDILRAKAILPTLLGINNELDELIGDVLRKGKK